jgi:hypothetical protein
MVAALGVAWILDGLEISVRSAVGDTLTRWRVRRGELRLRRADPGEVPRPISFMEREVQEKTGRALPPVDESKAIDVKAGSPRPVRARPT